MKALVVYQSRTGTTKKMAQEIASHLSNNNVEVSVTSIDEVTSREVENADKIFMGSWTSGFMLFGQKPNSEWKSFVKSLPKYTNKEVTLFATYKLATGSMFKKMREELRFSGYRVSNSAFKSKDGRLNETQKNLLELSLN